jgi:hypothetical protein
MIHAGRRRGPALVVMLLVGLAVATAIVRSGGRGGPALEPVVEYPAVAELRSAVSRCTEELAAAQERFDTHQRAVDSLRAAVLAYESRDRTVPAEEFEDYLEVFTAYNESVGEWHQRADALEAQWEECHGLTERHNAVVDSLSGRPPIGPTPGTG